LLTTSASIDLPPEVWNRTAVTPSGTSPCISRSDESGRAASLLPPPKSFAVATSLQPLDQPAP
jgi:hypothetical protein